MNKPMDKIIRQLTDNILNTPNNRKVLDDHLRNPISSAILVTYGDNVKLSPISFSDIKEAS